MALRTLSADPVVITGVGAVASVGDHREAVWQAVREGRSGVRKLDAMLGVPKGLLIGAPVDLNNPPPGRLKAIILAERAAEEAIHDSRVSLPLVDRDRFACSVSATVSDWQFRKDDDWLSKDERDYQLPWWEQWWPSSPAEYIGNKFGLCGPRLGHSTACASGLIGVMAAFRAIRDGQCDIALAGGGDAIDPLMAAGFRKMRALAHHEDPRQACRPFDRNRNGFVLGEGAAMFVLERLSHAMARGAKIYAMIDAGKMLAEAYHVTGLNAESEALEHLIKITLQAAQLEPADIGHINSHGTGTLQNDRVEMRGFRQALGRAADEVTVAANKSSLGHLVNAAGSMELAMTVLAMRDGFAPPTLNLTDPDPDCTINCMPLVGRENRFQHALKISVAFGGHLVALALSRWNDASSGFEYPTTPTEERRAA